MFCIHERNVPRFIVNRPFWYLLLGISENRCNIVARKFNQIRSLASKRFNFKCISGWFLGTYSKGTRCSFSQFYANPMYLNPAYAGNTECGRLNMNYRNQWPSVSNAYVTYSLAYDQSLAAINSGYGLMVMNDQQGDGAYNRTAFNAYYSYQLRLTSVLI